MIRRAGPDDMAAVLDIRARVFIEEQGVSEADERDGLDPLDLLLGVQVFLAEVADLVLDVILLDLERAGQELIGMV